MSIDDDMIYLLHHDYHFIMHQSLCLLVGSCDQTQIKKACLSYLLQRQFWRLSEDVPHDPTPQTSEIRPGSFQGIVVGPPTHILSAVARLWPPMFQSFWHQNGQSVALPRKICSSWMFFSPYEHRKAVDSLETSWSILNHSSGCDLEEQTCPQSSEPY